jgi:hypothetical protein
LRRHRSLYCLFWLLHVLWSSLDTGILARWPLHLTATHHVQMQMIDRLSAVDSIVNDDTKPIGTFRPTHLTGHEQQMSQQGLMRAGRVEGRLAQRGQSRSVLGNDQNVHGCHGIHVAKGQGDVVFVDFGTGNVAGYNLVKNRGRIIVQGRRSSIRVCLCCCCLDGSTHFIRRRHAATLNGCGSSRPYC